MFHAVWVNGDRPLEHASDLQVVDLAVGHHVEDDNHVLLALLLAHSQILDAELLYCMK